MMSSAQPVEGVIVPETDGVYRFQPSRWTEVTINGETVGEMDNVEMQAGESYAVRMVLKFDSGWPRDQLDKYAYLNWTDVSRDLEAEALAATEGADVILFFGGIDANLEGEEMGVELDGFLGGDRTHIKLPESHGKAAEETPRHGQAGRDGELLGLRHSAELGR